MKILKILKEDWEYDHEYKRWLDELQFAVLDMEKVIFRIH